MIISEYVFLWFGTIVVSGMILFWILWDGRNLIQFWGKRKQHQDEFFGAIMGLIMAAGGIIGLIRHHLSL